MIGARIDEFRTTSVDHIIGIVFFSTEIEMVVVNTIADVTGMKNKHIFRNWADEYFIDKSMNAVFNTVTPTDLNITVTLGIGKEMAD